MPDTTPAAELEKAQQEAVQLRRELLRWKMLARQHEARIREMEGSASWRLTAVLRMLPEVRRRWKILLLLGVLALLTLPLWPLLLVLMLLPRGRALLWSLLFRIRPLHDFLAYLKQRMQAGQRQTRGASPVVPLLFRRPQDAPPAAATPDAQQFPAQLMQQLCPQQRLQLERFRLTRTALLDDSELPELRSLSSAETGVLRAIVGQYPPAPSGQDAAR